MAVVIRTDTAVAEASERLTVAQEFALLRAAREADVTVPPPMWVCADDSVIGRPFFVMGRIAGTADGHRIIRDPALGGDRVALTRRLGEELARIHAIRPPRGDLDFLDPPVPDPTRQAVAAAQDRLDAMPGVYPAIQWGLRWALTHAPEPAPRDIVLTHRNYRTGNLMIDDHGLTAILGWDRAGWSDRHEDIGRFCAKCWRFGAHANEAGGIGPRQAFYAGYGAASDAEIDPRKVHYWEIMAHVRRAVTAMERAQRPLTGDSAWLELALCGRDVPELELEILMLTEEYDEGRVG